MNLETTLAEMRATADLDARAGAPVAAALRRAVAAIEAVLADADRISGSGNTAYAKAGRNFRAIIADALNGENHHG